MKRFPVTIAFLLAALAPMPSFAAAKKPVVPKTASYSVCPSAKTNVAAHKYASIQDAADAAVKFGARTVTMTLCGGTYAQDFDVESSQTFSFKGTNVFITGSGTKPDAFHLVGAGSLKFARGIDFKADTSASGVAMTAIRLENPGIGRGSLNFSRNNISGFAQAIVLINADMTLKSSNITNNEGGEGTATISVQGASCGKGSANVTFIGTGISHNIAGTILSASNANVKVSNSTFDNNTGTGGFVSGTCQRITANGGAFFMNSASTNPLFKGDADSSISIMTTSVFRNSGDGGNDFAQAYGKVSQSQSNVSQNTDTTP